MTERLFLGLLAGAAWNTASLWCLSRLLGSWIGPSPSRRWVPPPASGGAADWQEGERRQESHSSSPARFQSAFGGRWQVVGWLPVKLLLYAAAWWLLSRPAVSLIGFSLGFTLVLAAAAGRLLLRARRMAFARINGR